MRHACLFALLATVMIVDSVAQRRGLDDLIRDARLAPAEFEADALIRIAQLRQLDVRRRRELLNDAFVRAYGAQDPFRRTGLGIPNDSRQGADALASDSRLTRVSLQLRAVQLMALVDGNRARELFDWIEPGADKTPCDELLVPALAEYYTTLGAVARTAFATSERDDAFRFFEFHLWRAHLPSELPGVATSVLRFTTRLDEAQHFEGVLRFILEGATTDARGFSASALDIMTKFGELEDADEERGVRGFHLLRALRGYLKKQSAAPRCSDSAYESFAVETFNARVRRTGATLDGVPPLQRTEVQPSRMLGPARVDFFWRTPDARRLRDDYFRLRGADRNPVPMSVRQTKDWRDSAEHFLVDLEQWSGSREASERDYFYQKCSLLSDLIGLAPPSTVRTRAIRSYVDFLRTADLDRMRRALWDVFARRLLEITRPSADREAVVSAMESTGHPVLSLYAKLEKLPAEKADAGPRP